MDKNVLRKHPYLFSFSFFVSSRATMNTESKAYKLFITRGFPALLTFDPASIRMRNERLHATINKPLVGTFHGSKTEELISVDSAGIYLLFPPNTRSRLAHKSVPFSSTIIDIPITIYKPNNATQQNIVIYIHGGGK